jgi:hypothetical protein
VSSHPGEVHIDYTGVTHVRTVKRVVPQNLERVSTKKHGADKWVLTAIDLDKGQPCTIAMRTIHSWREAR